MSEKQDRETAGFPPLIILTGPTAVGKTALSIGLAKAVGGEIISADSMQVYRGMDIGTAKITPSEMQGVPHHLIDILDPEEPFHVAAFQEYCNRCIREIHERGHIPILVGGTGFYIQAVLYDIDFTQTDADTAYRNLLQEQAETQGAEVLHRQLSQVDPEAAEQIHPNNVKRIIRALEYYRQTGQKISAHNREEQKKIPPYHFRYYVLSLPREILYERINRRVDQMRHDGLENEVRRLSDAGCTRELVSMQGLGYKEILQAFDGEITMEEAYGKIKQETRHFAKRQFTWFRRERNVTWLDKTQFASEQALLEYCIRDLQEQGIIRSENTGKPDREERV